MAKIFLMLAVGNGLLAVMLGAFGAHALKNRLSSDLLVVYNTAVQYHFYHVFALALAALLLMQWPNSMALKISVCLFMAGLVLFSGSLYSLALSGVRLLGAITPLGGLAFIGGWLMLLVGIYKNA